MAWNGDAGWGEAGLALFYENATVDVEYKMIYVARVFGAPGLHQWRKQQWGAREVMVVTFLPSAGALASARSETLVTAAAPGAAPPEWLRAAARAEAAVHVAGKDFAEEL